MQNKTIDNLWEIINKKRGSIKKGSYSLFVALYISQKIKEVAFERIIENFDEKNLKWALQDIYEENGELIESLKELPKLSAEEWLLAIEKISLLDIKESASIKTPISIIKLVEKLLNIQNKDIVLDVCSGLGITLAHLSLRKDITLAGIELNPQVYIQSKLLLDVLNENTSNIILGNALKKDISPFKANKVFINGPLGLRVPKNSYEEVKVNKFNGTAYEGLIPNYDSTWIFVLDALLNSNFERMVVVTNEAPLVNNRDAMIRKQLIQDGFVEAIIDLPGRLLEHTNIPISLLVLSKNNHEVSFVDATKLGTKTRPNIVLNDEDIEDIISALEKDVEFSKTCAIEAIEKEDFTFASKRYLIPNLPYENTIQLKDVIKTINRGAMISNTNLKEIKSDKPTLYQYLTLNNFENGIVDKELPFLKKIDPSLERHVVKNDSLIVSKLSPFKVGSIELSKKQILVNANLYFLEVDEDKINPKYLEAYLQSEIGMRELQKYEKGSVMKTISIRDLEQLTVPMLTKEEQDEIGKDFELLKREQKVIMDRMKRIVEEKNNIMEVR